MQVSKVDRSADQISFVVVDLDEKCRRVTYRESWLEHFIRIDSSEIVIRNERLMLNPAVDNVLDDVKVKEFVSEFYCDFFIDHFSYIAGTKIELQATIAVGASS